MIMATAIISSYDGELVLDTSAYLDDEPPPCDVSYACPHCGGDHMACDPEPDMCDRRATTAQLFLQDDRSKLCFDCSHYVNFHAPAATARCGAQGCQPEPQPLSDSHSGVLVDHGFDDSNAY